MKKMKRFKQGSGAQVVGSPSRGASADAVRGMLPETTVDGQDWGEWAREWREDPGGKADRLVKQWEAESSERGESAGREFQVPLKMCFPAQFSRFVWPYLVLLLMIMVCSHEGDDGVFTSAHFSRKSGPRSKQTG